MITISSLTYGPIYEFFRHLTAEFAMLFLDHLFVLLFLVRHFRW
jgi:hypothetical protein